MKTKIVFVVENGLSEEEKADLRYLFADAVAEFADKRFPADLYVERRYTHHYEMFREKKVVEVARRVKLARELHDTMLSFELVDEE